MIIYLPSWPSDSCLRLPIEFKIYLRIIRIFIRNHCLFIISWEIIAAVYRPYSFSIGFVICELTFIKCTIWENPFSFNYFILLPSSYQLHPSCSIYICSFSFLFTKLPPPRICIFVLIRISSLTMFGTILPLPCIKI